MVASLQPARFWTCLCTVNDLGSALLSAGFKCVGLDLKFSERPIALKYGASTRGRTVPLKFVLRKSFEKLKV